MLACYLLWWFIFSVFLVLQVAQQLHGRLCQAALGITHGRRAVAIEPKTKTDRDALSAALNKLAKEDPSFRVKEEGFRVVNFF